MSAARSTAAQHPTTRTANLELYKEREDLSSSQGRQRRPTQLGLKLKGTPSETRHSDRTRSCTRRRSRPRLPILTDVHAAHPARRDVACCGAHGTWARTEARRQDFSHADPRYLVLVLIVIAELSRILTHKCHPGASVEGGEGGAAAAGGVVGAAGAALGW